MSSGEDERSGISEITAFTEDDAHKAAILKFKAEIEKDEDILLATAAISALVEVIRRSPSTTEMGLLDSIDTCSKLLQNEYPQPSVRSGCELFKVFATRRTSETQNLAALKEELMDRGDSFITQSHRLRIKVAQQALPFMQTGSSILVFGYSRVVQQTLLHAKAHGRDFSVVFVLSALRERDDCCMKAVRGLRAVDIPVTLVPEGAVVTVIREVSFCLVGAEAVVQNGGILNVVGTHQLGLLCHSFHVPFYVVAETVKFLRLSVLGQHDVPATPLTRLPRLSPSLTKELAEDGVEVLCPASDYTPPELVTLIISNLGMRTTASVAEELVRLYS